MGILEKEIYIGLANKNIKHFENLNYEIPFHKDRKGTRRLKVGVKILVNINDLMTGSTIKITKICDICGIHVKNQPYNSILYSRKKTDGKDRCNDCGNKYANTLQTNNVNYNKSLEFHAIINKKEFLLGEFSRKNEKEPSKISHGSQKKYWWVCPIFGKQHEYDMKIANRVIKGQGCPYCSNQRVNETNCLWTTHPFIAKMLFDPNIGYDITFGSNRKEEFVCPNCLNRTGRKNVSSVVRCGLSCSKCSDGVSYPEKFVFCVINQLKVEFETQKKFEWSIGKKYDFYIHSIDCIIETHGLQHYELGFEKLSKKSLSEEKENDNIKKNLSKLNGVKKYIIIDCSKSEIEYIKQNIINSDISFLYDLSNINWMLCHEYACHSLVRDVCNLWMAGYKDMRTISDKTKLGFSTVAKYIKQGTLLGWCDYNPEDGIKNSSRYPDRPVVRLSLDGAYIEGYKSISDACKLLDISVAAISSVCMVSSKSKSAGGFMWMYKEDYELYECQIKPYKRKFNNKPVVRLTLEGKYIDEFESATKACEKLGIGNGHVSSACTGKRKTVGGFRWMFKKDYENSLKRKIQN